MHQAPGMLKRAEQGLLFEQMISDWGRKKLNHKIELQPNYIPRVLMLGNGILRLAGGGNWDKLLRDIEMPPPKGRDLSKVPYAMQPEVLCGVNVEEVQRRTAQAIKENAEDSNDTLKRILSLPFDAVLTTNYTYEIETILSGKEWTEKERRKSFTALDGNSHVRHNTSVCNMVSCADGRTLPVFHIHGERMRKHSLVLSYYSYANSVSKLINLNKNRGNTYQEKQESGELINVLSWLDYFLMGDVYAVGLGFDPSEFDIWWAVERKAREKAKHGDLYAIMTEEKIEDKPQKMLFEAMSVKLRNYPPEGEDYQPAYEGILADLQKEL